MSDWLTVLRDACAIHGQAVIGRRLRYSAPVISQTLSGTYKGDLKRVQAAVEGALMQATVECPIAGELSRDRCIDNQRRAPAATNPARIAFARACPKCPHRSQQ